MARALHAFGNQHDSGNRIAHNQRSNIYIQLMFIWLCETLGRLLNPLLCCGLAGCGTCRA